MFDPATTAMICVRGGYGVMRLLWQMYMFVNYDRSQAWKTPKRILGYSDVTALLLASYSLMRWASVHGPMLVDSGKGNETLDSLVDVFTKAPKDFYPGNLVSNTLKVAGKIPDQRRTWPRPATGCRPGARPGRGGTFGKLELRFTGTKCYSTLEGHTLSAPYVVVAKDRSSVAIVSRDAFLEEDTISHIHFEGSRFWINVGTGIIREFFTRVTAPAGARKTASRSRRV